MAAGIPERREPTRMGIATSLKRHCVETVSWQSPAVLGVKPAFEEPNALKPLDTHPDFCVILEPLPWWVTKK